MENNQTTAIETANNTASSRADEAVRGVSTSTLEATPVQATVPEVSTVVPELPIYSFTRTTPDETARQEQVNRGRQMQGETLGDIYSGLADIGTRGETTMRLEDEAGISRMSTELTEIENELTQKSLAFRRERERITAGGGTKAQIDNILAERGRKQNQELADLEVIRSARSNTLTNAQNLINRKVELEFADKQAQVDALKFIYNENKSVLDKEDDRLFQQTIKREERGFEIAKQQYVQTETEKMRYVANAAQAGADNNTLRAIQGAKSLDELYALPGVQNYALSPSEKLEIAINQRNYDLLGIEIQTAEKAAEAAENARKNGTLTEDQYKIADELRKEHNNLQEVKDAKDLEGNTAALLAALEQENGVGDISAINSFQRLVVDPGVAVREQDVALLQSAQSFTDMASLKAQGLVKGDKLTPKGREQMEQLVRDVYNFRVGLVNQNTEQIRNTAQERGIDYGKYVGKNFKTYEEIAAQLNPELVAEWGLPDADSYTNSVISAISADPSSNPFGIDLSE